MSAPTKRKIVLTKVHPDVKIQTDLQAHSSVVERHFDMVKVGGSIPLAPTR